MKIKNISTAKNKFCGPAVISSITGLTTDEAEKAIQEVVGNNKPVVGVWSVDLCETFKRLGYRCTYYTHLDNSGSLFYILSVLSDGIYVLVVPGHYVCVEIDGPRRYLCDNHTRKPLMAAISARGSQRVLTVIGVEKVG